MQRSVIRRGSFAVAFLGAAIVHVASCSGERGPDGGGLAQAPDASLPLRASGNARAAEGATVPGYFAGPVDTSRAVVQRGPRIGVSRAESSLAFRDLPVVPDSDDNEEHEREPGKLPRAVARLIGPDPVLQSDTPISSLPAAIVNFIGQGLTNSSATQTGTPPDTNGAIGLNHYVQTVNGGIAIWNKSGTIVAASKATMALWTGYVGTNAGNSCATNNNGDPVVIYDTMADRWFITQFSLPNANSGPNFQCVAVSKTSDPTGEYWLYDFQYPGLNDYGKFGVWPDAYYATFNMFNGAFGGDADICAYDRVKMLKGQTATQQCFQQNNGLSGLLPVSMDGHVMPPKGEPGWIAGIGSTNNSSVDLFQFHVDWTTPSNTTFNGPTIVPVAPFNPLCNGGACVPQPSPGNPLATLSDRAMFRLNYRNFGTHESLLFNHSVDAGTTGGVRWYEIRSPLNPVVFQQGTFGPADGNWRWMGSIAQDQAQGMSIGYSISSATLDASIAWTGRLAGDPVNTMPQGETIIDVGTGVETGRFSNGQLATRWGDYSAMTVDPVDDCTFWYTTELYHTTGPIPRTWDTQIAAFKFPSCGANDFAITVTPSLRSVARGGQVTYTVTTTPTAATAEQVALNIQDLPTGVTAAFSPPSVTAGTPSTLTLTAAASGPLTGTPAPTFTVIGKAPSAVHPAYAQLSVTPCVPITTCPSPDNCGTIPDGCGGQVSCGAACTAPQTCGGGGAANVCGCTPLTACPAGTNCGTIDNRCGGQLSCGAACTAPQTCGGGGAANVCGCTPITACPAGANCGTIDDRCGGQLSCGPACAAPQTCGGGGATNVCGCTPITACPAGSDCGKVDDRCGGQVTCGPACTAPKTCGGGGTPNKCACAPTTCSAQGASCGSIPDGCGANLDCGSCTGSQTCAQNKCVDNGTDAGAPDDAGTLPDASTPRDAGVRRDAAVADSGSGGDAGDGGDATPPPADGGCGCRTAQVAGASPVPALLGLGLLGALRLRRRRR